MRSLLIYCLETQIHVKLLGYVRLSQWQLSRSVNNKLTPNELTTPVVAVQYSTSLFRLSLENAPFGFRAFVFGHSTKSTRLELLESLAMNTIYQKSSDCSSGFDELDDDVFDLEAPIRSDVEPGNEVYSSQLSFAINFEAEPSPNYEFVASDTDSGFNFSLTSLEPESSESNCGFDTDSTPFAQICPQPIVERNEEKSESNGSQRASKSEEGTNDSSGNSLSQCEINNLEETDPNSDEESIGETTFLSCIPDSILSVYRRIHEKFSDYSFAYVIAGQMCHRTFPFECYHSVKLGLMLSVISTHVSRQLPD